MSLGLGLGTTRGRYLLVHGCRLQALASREVAKPPELDGIRFTSGSSFRSDVLAWNPIHDAAR